MSASGVSKARRGFESASPQSGARQDECKKDIWKVIPGSLVSEAVRQGRQPIKRILLSKLPPRALSFILLRNQNRTHTSVIPLEGCGSQGIYTSDPVSYCLPDALSSTDPLVLLLACSALRQRCRCWQQQVSQIYVMEGSRNYG